jgi:DNA-binding CsgD family transcriptional regulator
LATKCHSLGHAPLDCCRIDFGGFSSFYWVIKTKKKSEFERLSALAIQKHRLSQKQCDVLWMMLHGKPYKEIASDLGLSMGTIKYHAQMITAKMGARTRVHAGAKFFRLRA